LITREDNPALTDWRMGQLLAGKSSTLDEIDEWLWFNSKDQSPQFRLDDPAQLADMLAALREVKPELVILDVFNVLHQVDENDPTGMRKVLDCADQLHRELKASVCILHHFNKSNEGRLTHRMRGASSIAGWAEWVIGLSLVSQDSAEKIRSLEFELKA